MQITKCFFQDTGPLSKRIRLSRRCRDENLKVTNPSTQKLDKRKQSKGLCEEDIINDKTDKTEKDMVRIMLR